MRPFMSPFQPFRLRLASSFCSCVHDNNAEAPPVMTMTTGARTRARASVKKGGWGRRAGHTTARIRSYGSKSRRCVQSVKLRFFKGRKKNNLIEIVSGQPGSVTLCSCCRTHLATHHPTSSTTTVATSTAWLRLPQLPRCAQAGSISHGGGAHRHYHHARAPGEIHSSASTCEMVVVVGTARTWARVWRWCGGGFGE